MSGDLPDKDYLYGKWQKWKDRKMDWRDNLSKSLAHKALDIGEEDDLQVTNANRSQNGITWKELAVIAAALLGGGALYNNWNNGGNQSPPAAVSPADSEYEVRFYDSDGKLIEIPPISSRSER